MQYLENKTAIVTGGAQGIGRGITLELAKAGANIIIADLNTETAQAVIEDARNVGRDAIAIPFDVTNKSIISDSIQIALDHFQQIDILVNNAGILTEQGFLDTTTEEFDLSYEVNLKGVWQVVNALVPHFKEHNSGKIVNIASGAARQGLAACPAYSAAKAGVISLTQSLASALGADNINVNAICPGLVKTPLTEKGWDVENNPGCFERYVEEHTALGRLVTPQDIGQAVVFLASSRARNITGQTLNVNSGDVMS